MPAAYSIVFGKLKKPDSVFFWFLSTTLLPPVRSSSPSSSFSSICTFSIRLGMIIVYSRLEHPDRDLDGEVLPQGYPSELLEAADIDGATRPRSFFRSSCPWRARHHISTALLVFIFVWNEFFFAINLTYVKASPIPVYMASYMTQEGLFWAKLSAISTLTSCRRSCSAGFRTRRWSAA